LTYSRAGMASRAGSVSVRDPNQNAADVDNINIHSPDNIERERYYAQVRLEIKAQFEHIDKNHDGYVDRDELVNFMMS